MIQFKTVSMEPYLARPLVEPSCSLDLQNKDKTFNFGKVCKPFVRNLTNKVKKKNFLIEVRLRIMSL